MMRYADVCAGISAATVAWKPLGWKAAFYAEIDRFPSAVLAHHYPETPNRGDMARFDEWPDADLDVLIGGTPCQGFSIAGQRKGLDDPRSNLALCYGRIAQRYRPRWIVWENVPGVRSLNAGRDLGAFLRGLVELGYGVVFRSFDAQFAGLAQRRERVFVVGYLGDWRPAAAVLFEPEGMCWHPAPRREAGKRVAGTIAGGARSSGGYSHDDIPLVSHDPACTLTARERKGPLPEADLSTVVAQPLLAKGNSSHQADRETYIAHALRAEGFDASEDGTGRGTPIVPIAFSSKDHGADAGELAPTLRAMTHDGSHANGGGQVAVALDMRNGTESDLAHTIQAAGLGSERGGNPNAIPHILRGWAVRRLTPRECERLQGLPDDYTRIAWRGKPAEECPDGPRYRALGNSIAVPELRWIGARIALCDSLLDRREAA